MTKKKPYNNILFLLGFVIILILVNYILKDKFQHISGAKILRDITVTVFLVLPGWISASFLIRYMNKNSILTKNLPIRIIRNMGIASILSLISVALLTIIRNLIFNKPDDDPLVVQFTVFFIINYTIMQFFDYFSYFMKEKNDELLIEKEKNKILNLKYQILSNQINPHFLFNSLNILSSLIYEDQDKANKYTKEISKLYRYILNASKEDIAHLDQEIQFLESFYHINSLRFPESINLNIDNKVKDYNNYIIPLSLQLLVENAIKHNTFSKDNPLNISIKVDNHKIVVTNNINPRNINSTGSGFGLKYIQSNYYKFGYLIEISQSDKLFSVTIPIIFKNDIRCE
ncbi:hypothetical protein EYV94_14455 [Puteibacter caeruleilacunae]|nr:hypothetical protein EYV94_14455 [Puteibacter caeruleilacunae]